MTSVNPASRDGLDGNYKALTSGYSVSEGVSAPKSQYGAGFLTSEFAV